MFEKEAEDNKPPYAYCALDTSCKLWNDGFQKGAEFGFNKANEWHYPLTLDKDGQPISDNPVAESYPIEILMYDFETGSKEVIMYDTSWDYYRKDGSSIRRNNIAWQYIDIPAKKGV